MSYSTMADIALDPPRVRRRRGTPRVNERARPAGADNAGGNAPANAGDGAADDGNTGNSTSKTVSAALTLVMAYIPTEIITLYVGYRALIHEPDPTKYRMADQWWAFWLFLWLSPVVAWAVYGIKLRAKDGTSPLKLLWPLSPVFHAHFGTILWNAIVGMIAYAAWATALPDSPHTHQKLLSAADSAFLVAVAAVILATLSGLFGPPAKAE